MFTILPTPYRTVLSLQSLQTISPTQYAYTFPASPSFTHLVVFLLPDQVIPANTLAGIYLHLPSMEPGEFKLLGALGPVLDENGNIRPDNDNIKVSAIFKVTGLSPSTRATGGVGDMEMDFECMQIGNDNGEVTVGLSLEPINILGPQILALRAAKSQVNVETSVAVASKPENSTPKTPNAKLLAQRIIQNAFNFLASFSSGGAHDVVPLKAFEDWWRKFEDKMNSDPEYLERDT